MKSRGEMLDRVFAIANDAASIITRWNRSEFDVSYKSPGDPVTPADHEANDWICDALSTAYPGIPIVAEESDPESYRGFETAPEVWFVDPLDGTREFVGRRSEFAVMIGFAEGGRATLGVLVCPALGRSFLGAEGVGAFEVNTTGDRHPIHVSSVRSMREAQVVVSRSRRTPTLETMLGRLGPRAVIPCGSSGVKASRIATAEADIYLHPGHAGSRWDSCAPEAIVRAAGGTFTNVLGETYDYTSTTLENLRGFVATNGFLHDAVLNAYRELPVVTH